MRTAPIRLASVVVARGRPARTNANAVAMRALGVDATTPKKLGYVDTHTHLNLVLPKLEMTLEHYMSTADATCADSIATLDACVSVGCSARSLEPTAAIVAARENVFGAYGIHPLSAEEWFDDETRRRVRELLSSKRCVAVGETGLDYHRLSEDEREVEEMKKTQRAAFAEQMKLAGELDLPLVVHTREAEEDTLELMKTYLKREHKVHVHCFTSSAHLARELLDAFPNLCLGFTGVATFKNGDDVRGVIETVDLDRILLETDAPYMAPTPFRGQTCHPAMIPKIAEAIARVKNVDVSTVFETTRENTRRVYGI